MPATPLYDVPRHPKHNQATSDGIYSLRKVLVEEDYPITTFFLKTEDSQAFFQTDQQKFKILEKPLFSKNVIA